MSKTRLYAPPAYYDLSEVERARICNGCGTKGLGGLIVPDTLWGLEIEDACDIHDFMWHEGSTIEDKREADRIFLNNMLRLIDGGSKWLKWIRRRRAYKYYEGVAVFGGPAFWAGKN